MIACSHTDHSLNSQLCEDDQIKKMGSKLNLVKSKRLVSVKDTTFCVYNTVG